MNKKQNIQFWRVIACLMVFTVHFSQRMWIEGRLGQLAEFGKYGVFLFFIISGYLIANSCEAYARKNTFRYILKRMIKILPLYYFVIAYYYVMHNYVFCDVVEDPLGYGWLRYLLVLNGIVPATGLYFWDNLGITWTIPYFVWSYISLPVLLKFIKGYYGAVCCFFLSFLIVRNLGVFGGNMLVLTGLPYFLEGIVIYYALKEHKKLLTCICVCILALFQVVYSEDLTMFYSLVFSLFILLTESMQIKNGWAKKILDVCDKYSYTFYLVHGMVFIHILDRYALTRPLRAMVAIIGTIILTLIIHHFIEIPIQRFLNCIVTKYEAKQKTLPC